MKNPHETKTVVLQAHLFTAALCLITAWQAFREMEKLLGYDPDHATEALAELLGTGDFSGLTVTDADLRQFLKLARKRGTDGKPAAGRRMPL